MCVSLDLHTYLHQEMLYFFLIGINVYFFVSVLDQARSSNQVDPHKPHLTLVNVNQTILLDQTKKHDSSPFGIT